MVTCLLVPETRKKWVSPEGYIKIEHCSRTGFQNIKIFIDHTDQGYPSLQRLWPMFSLPSRKSSCGNVCAKWKSSLLYINVGQFTFNFPIKYMAGIIIVASYATSNWRIHFKLCRNAYMFMKSSLLFEWHILLMTLWIHCTKAYKAELCVFPIKWWLLILHFYISSLILKSKLYHCSDSIFQINAQVWYFSILQLFLLFLSLSITSLTQTGVTCEE